MNLLNRSAESVSDNPIHQHAVDNPAIWNAVSAALTTAGYYAVPDFVQSRGARAAAKAAIALPFVGMQLHQAVEFTKKNREEVRELEIAEDVMDDDGAPVVAEEPDAASATEPLNPLNAKTPQFALALTGIGAVTAGLVVVGEKLVYGRAEKLRARGVSKPHAKQGLVLAGLVGILTAVTDVVDSRVE